MRLKRALLASVAAASLAGCAVGPDFVSPAAPSVEHYTPENLSQAGSERLSPASEIPRRWWQVFHNKNLSRLVEAAIEHNPSLQAAEASVRVAFYNAEAQKGGFLPSVLLDSNDSTNLQSGVQQVVSANGPTNPYGFFTKSLTVSYTPDIWGANRRSVESLEAQTDQQRYQLEAAYLSLTTNVTGAAIQEAMLRGQIAATREVIKQGRDLLVILRKQYGIGAAAQADVLVQEAALAQMEQLLPPLEKSLAQQRDLLTALAGQYSTAQVPETFNMKSLPLPRHLPLTLPAAFVRQRPDVRAAEANMHSTSALIGVAIAARLPNVTLSAQGGYSAYSFAQLLLPGTGFYTLAAGISQPIFQGFTLLNKQRAAEAGLVQAEAQYRQAVITAFQNVADALRALQADTKAVDAATHSEVVARKSFDIVKKQFTMTLGSSVNMLQLLNAEQTWLLAANTRIQAEGARLGDIVGLFMALGGDWKDENLKNLTPDSPRHLLADFGTPDPREVEKIYGPVNSSWFPTVLDASDKPKSEVNPPPISAPPLTAAPPQTAPAAAGRGESGWFPSFLD